jgi:hypothetical protein
VEADATASGCKDLDGKKDMVCGDDEDCGGEAEMASNDEKETDGCWGRAGTGGSLSFSLEPEPKTNLRSISWHTEHWRVSCLKLPTIPASSGFTAVKIISPPHIMQRMTPTLITWEHPNKTRAYGRIHDLGNCR